MIYFDIVSGESAENMREKQELPQEKMKKSSGLVYVFTGDGKGKTSAALGMLARALAHGWRVGWVSWYKSPSWNSSENNLKNILTKEAQKRLTFVLAGEGFYLSSISTTNRKKIVHAGPAVIVDTKTAAEHQLAAQKALEYARELLQTVDVLFLDEVCNAISDRLVNESDVLSLLFARGSTHVVLTGRNASAQIQKEADLVSSLQKMKHPFDVGMVAVQGLDF